MEVYPAYPQESERIFGPAIPERVYLRRNPLLLKNIQRRQTPRTACHDLRFLLPKVLLLYPQKRRLRGIRIYQFENVTSDSPELLRTLLAVESDATCKRNVFVFSAQFAKPKAVDWILIGTISVR